MKKDKKAAILFWVLTIICMGIIFYFSSRPATESASQSSWLIDILQKIFGVGFSSFIIRKCAHFLEFTGLCVLFNSAWYFTKSKKCILLSIICTSLYAITDEVHQIFIDGRSCEFRDWCIDSCGAITGAIGFLIVYAIIDAIVKQIKSKS